MSIGRMGRSRVAGVVLAVGGVLAALGSAAPAAFAETCKTGAAAFESTGEQQCYEVPAGVSKLSVTAAGGSGGLGGRTWGGFGAVVSGVLTVTPGSTLYVEVGSNGCNNPGCSDVFGGGGRPAEAPTAGSGGGASDVRGKPVADAEESLESRLLVAGGGGGGGGTGADGPGQPPGGPGGSAGFDAFGDGENGQRGTGVSNQATAGEGGQGGTPSAGGKGGEGGFGETLGLKGEDGAFGIGGGGVGCNFCSGSAGGGGGWYGGGAGGSGGENTLSQAGGGGGGGAGSSHAAPGVSEVSIATDTTGEVGTPGAPEVTIAPAVPTSIAQCQKNGWKNFGSMFKNQGKCVKFVEEHA